jgi:hypothetical protein
MAATNHNLTRRHQTWYVTVEVPPSLQHALGRRIARTLGTRDVAVARAKRHAAIAAIQATIAAARQSGPTPIVREAEGWRESIVAETRGGDPERLAHGLMLERVETLVDQGRTADARTLHGIATGTAISPYVDVRLAEGGTRRRQVAEKSKNERRTVLRNLVA